MGLERLGRGDVGRDPEVGADASKDVVDVERAERSLELGRPPPVVALQRVVAEVDEPASAGGGVERLLVHAPSEPPDARRQPLLRGRAGDQPGLVAGAGTVGDQGLDRRQRDHEIAQPEGDGGHEHPAHRQSSAYTVRSHTPDWAKARRRSAHLLQRPQWRSRRGSMHENVCRRARSRPRSTTSILLRPT